VSIIQFLRILWARKGIIALASLACVIGAILVGLVLPPRWQAHSRVMLDLIKPDPVTGQVLGNNIRPYVATQIELIKDYAVAGQVADDLGLLSDPNLIRAYQRRSKKDTRDFRRFVTQMIVDGSDAELVEGSNILQITYTGSTPEQARTIADALRKAYMESSRSFRIEQAAKNAEWYEGQAEKARQSLEEAEKIESDYEKANGIVLEKEGVDLEAQRLQVMAAAPSFSAPVYTAPVAPPASAAKLSEVDNAITEASKTLGPNHPQLLALRNERASLQQQVITEQNAARATARASAAAASAPVGALQSAMTAQRQRVMAQRDKVERARQLQQDVNLRRDLYSKTAQKAADFRHEAAAPVTNITILGGAVTPQSPKFPNWPLIILGSVILGLGMGVGVGLLMEFFGRRIRGPEDLISAIDAPVLAVVTATRDSKRGGMRFWRPAIKGWNRKSGRPSGPKAAAA
jgi:uncharacterized protein involved in exopolysaccharide biosynthesis